MPFVARFVDGPLAGADHERVFIGADRLDCLYLCPNPVPSSALGWILIGYEPGLAPDADAPWPGQVRYQRAGDESLHEPGMDPIYLFELAS